MEYAEPEEGVVVVRRRKRLNKTQRNVIIGVVTVAGLGLVGKLVSVLRRERPKQKKKNKDKDVQTLESVLSGDESSLPLQARVQRTKLANLDNDEPDDEVVSRKRNTRRSKYADSFSEIVSEDDIPHEGEMLVNQDPVGRRDRENIKGISRDRENSRDGRNDTIHRKTKQLSLSEGGFNIKGVSHFSGEKVDEDEGRHGGRRRSEDEEKHRREDEEKHRREDGEKHRREDAEKHRREDRGQNHHEEGSESPPNRSRKEVAKEMNKKESFDKSSSSEKKPRRSSFVEAKQQQGRKSKAGGEEKVEKRKLNSLPELSDDREVKEVIFDEAGRWESVNGYKVLRATTSKLPTFAEAMHKFEADGSSLAGMNHDNVHLVREFERERAETEKAQSIWDGKIHLQKKKNAVEGSEAYLQIKSSVVSSVAGTEETPEGVKVREVVKRSTLLPIPSGDESEVHSSVYNVRETEKGLKVEEVVTRTKLLPVKGDFTLSDQQLLRKTRFRNNPAGQFKRNDALVLMLRIVAVLVILFSVLLVLYSRKR